MFRMALCLGVIGAISAVGPARADEPLADVAGVHAACRQGERPGPREVYVIDVPRFRFATYDPREGRLSIDTRRNLRALRGAVEVLPAGLEEIAFVASPSRAREIRRDARALRVGFFLGFDGVGQRCVIRSPAEVTLVRAELAYVELLDAEGDVIAREDTERLRAWLDDRERDRIDGAGPRAAVGAVSIERGAGASDAAWRAPELKAALDRCHAEAVAEGAPAEGMAVVRLRTDASGRLVERALAISDLPLEGQRRCVLEVVSSVALPPGDRVWRVPLRFAAD